ncbi:pyridoxal phosphate-dependent aminotransferase [Oscillospiraceae bacterium LTW-04]|nr:pyridoxal phosphate-dependent aminotransferase [Oscillospiraceae bacterium MB24-C1]
MRFSSKIQRCNPSPIRKFYPYQVELQKRGVKIYNLNIGQPDIKTPEAYFDVCKTFSDPVLAYAPSPGIPSLINAIQTYYAGLGCHYKEDEIIITAGGSEALWFTLNAILDDGDEILIPEPFYPNYNTFTNTTGAKVVPIPTSPEKGYRYVDRAKIESLITPNTRALMFTNPGNPTGVVLSEKELRILADIAKSHDLFLIADEVYREFVYGGEKITSIGQFDDIADNAIIIDSVSKRFSACGSRVGCLISRNRELQKNVLKLCQARLSVATLEQLAAAALYHVGPNYFSPICKEYKKRRDTVYEGIRKIPGVVCVEPQGAFYMMAKLPIDNAEQFMLWLLTEFSDNNETVIFAPGAGFYATPGKGQNEIRIAYVLNCSDLARAMELLGLAVEQYNKRGEN